MPGEGFPEPKSAVARDGKRTRGVTRIESIRQYLPVTIAFRAKFDNRKRCRVQSSGNEKRTYEQEYRDLDDALADHGAIFVAR